MYTRICRCLLEMILVFISIYMIIGICRVLMLILVLGLFIVVFALI